MKIKSVLLSLFDFVKRRFVLTKVKMHHPSKWGDGYFLNGEDSIPFKLVDNRFVECAPINIPKDFKPRVYLRKEVEIVILT
jgi:hypothetical protein